MSWYDPFNSIGTAGGIAGDVTNSFFPNPANGASGYLTQLDPMYHQYYDPYIEYGMNAMPTLEQQYSQLLSNPASVQQMLGSGYQQSPGYQYQYDQAMNASNSAASAGGMLGTPAHQQQAMGTAQGLANQDYWKYYNQNANLYGMGLQGTQGMFDDGYDASQGLANSLGSAYKSQAALQYAGQASQNQATGNLLGGLMGMFSF